MLRSPWVVFAIQQGLMFASGWAVLAIVRRATGRTLHGGVDPAGPVDGLAVLALYAAHFALARWLYRTGRGRDAPPLGLAPSRRGLLEFGAGALAAAAVAACPALFALWSGRARVVGTLAGHWREVGAASIAFGVVVLLVNSLVEEVTSRALPMRLWADRPLWFRALVPSLAFAALHWMDEPVRLGAFASRTLAGVTLSLAYAATGNVWLAVGVHTGMNYGSAVTSGLWHFGAVVRLADDAPAPGWAGHLVMTLLAVGLYALRHPHRAPTVARGTARGAPASST